MKDPFVHLHVHSEYSFLDGYGHPEQFVARAKSLGQRAIAITDHGNVSAHKKWSDACKEEGIKPLLGVEAYVADDSSKKERQRWHITLLAKNLVGYRNILSIVSKAWQEGFYYKPRTDWEILKHHSEGVIATSGCPSGKIGRSIIREGWDEKSVATELKRQASLFKDYYAELSPWTFPEGVKVARMIYSVAKAEGIPLVETMDAHYPEPKDAHIQDVMLCIQNKVKFNDPERMKFSQQDFCINSGDEMAAKWRAIHGKGFPLLDEMILNTGRIADECSLEFPTATPLAFPYEGDKVSFLRQLCEEGLRLRGLEGRNNYRERLEYEFSLVCSKNFIDYFLVVADLIVWAKNNGVVVGAARGSSCGSLMCYLMRITEIDPIPHGLIFERFIDVSRADLPDIDIDFESERRNEVKAYLEMKYGSDRVANLATFGTFKGKLCLQDIGRVFSDTIPVEAVEETKRLIVQRSSADARAGFTIEDTFVNFEQAAEHLKKYPELGLAKEMEGQIRQLGVHAAGVVISNEPIGNFASVYVTSKKDKVISMDYDDASSVGLLKIDILGLTVLTAIKHILLLIKKQHGIDVDLSRIRFDDEEVYDNFCRNHLHGIFQFEGESTRQVCRQIQPKNFRDIVAINALSRPGPLHSGGTTNFIERRFGRQEIKSVHPIYDRVTKDTYGITVYQEQVMNLVREMGKFSWSETSTIRKAMSKKMGDEFFISMGRKFSEGAVSQGVSEDVAKEVFANICTFGSWAFNMSHSVAYSTTAYQLMWLKTHYPIEFYTGTANCENDDEKKRRLLKEYSMGGGKVLPVCVNRSAMGVSSEKQGLRLGLDSVVGLGKKAEKLIAARPFKHLADFELRHGLPAGQKEKLLKIGAARDLDYVVDQGDLFGDQSKFNYKEPKREDVMEFCPLAVENDIYSKWRGWLEKRVKDKIYSVRDLDLISERKDVLIFGSTNPKTSYNLKNRMEEEAGRGHEWKAKEGEEDLTREQYNFLNFNIEDDTDNTIVRISYKLYPKFKTMMWALKPGAMIAVRGMVTGTMRMVFAFSIVDLAELRKALIDKKPLTKDQKEFLEGKKTNGGGNYKKKSRLPTCAV